jgi:hypothetical protein
MISECFLLRAQSTPSANVQVYFKHQPGMAERLNSVQHHVSQNLEICHQLWHQGHLCVLSYQSSATCFLHSAHQLCLPVQKNDWLKQVTWLRRFSFFQNDLSVAMFHK